MAGPSLRPTWLQIRGSHALLPLGFNIFLEQLTELRGILTFTRVVKDMRKDTDEQPDEARWGTVPSAEASVPVELACTTL